MEIQQKDQLIIGRIALLKDGIIEKCIENKNKILLIGLCLLISLFSILGFVKKFQGSPQKDYLIADMTFERWSSVAEKNPELLNQLEKVLKKHPHLHSKFDGAIGCHLLFQNETEKAFIYLQPTLQRIKGTSPYHKEFALTSLLIAKGDLKGSLSKAKELKGKMEADLNFWEKQSTNVRYGALLYAYNLMRIAALEKETGTPQGELSALQEIEKNLALAAFAPATSTDKEKWNSSLERKICDTEAYGLLQHSFQAQHLSLRDYINHRKTQIGKQS